MTSDTKLNVLLIFISLLGMVWAILSIRSLLHRFKVRKRIALLRTNPEEIPLYTNQPLHLALQPSALTKKVSLKGHSIFFAVWFGFLIVIGFIGLLIRSTSLSNVLLDWIRISGIFSSLMVGIHVLVAMVLYQHIETNETELIVQRGLIRRRIS